MKTAKNLLYLRLNKPIYLLSSRFFQAAWVTGRLKKPVLPADSPLTVLYAADKQHTGSFEPFGFLFQPLGDCRPQDW